MVFAGDSINISAKVSDPKTPLSTLSIKIVMGNRLIKNEKFRTKGREAEVNERFKIPFISELKDGMIPEIFFVLENVEGDTTQYKLTSQQSLEIKRPVLNNILYLVTNDGKVIELKKSGSREFIYEAESLDIKGNSIQYKIAEKITSENEIDYSGFVWGDTDGLIEPSDEMSNYITTKDAKYKTIEKIEFDTYTFETSISGKRADPGILYLEDFTNATMNGEAFKKIELTWTNGMEITLEGELASYDIVLNPTFFDRTSENKAKFLGNDGIWSVYYSPVRKMVIVSPEKPAFPDLLFAMGWGLGYPTKVTSDAIKLAYPSSNGRVTTNWERRGDHLLDYIYFRQISANTYQGTVYMPGDHDNFSSFKFFEDLNWAGEKNATDFTFTGVNIISVASDGNWEASAGIEHTYYRFTLNLSSKTVNIEKVTLP